MLILLRRKDNSVFRPQIYVLICLWMTAGIMSAQENTNTSPFRQLTEELPAPNGYRTASGRPGPDYFQQQADYKIDIKLDEENNSLSGKEIITYYNNSRETLTYLWFQLDQNILEKNSFGDKISVSDAGDQNAASTLARLNDDFNGGFRITSVTDIDGRVLKTIINHTVMKVLLNEAVKPGGKTELKIVWNYEINNLRKNWARSGYDPFPGQNNNIYAIAQFYPRLCVFNDYGWQIKQYTGAEFALEFGDFDVSIEVPSDHIVAATGILLNDGEVLSSLQRRRVEAARYSDKPVFIVTPEEALENEMTRSAGAKKWRFRANNVRDFAFASSRKFIWDAMGVTIGDNRILAMSYYPKEAEPLWSKYSTKTIAHTLRVYSGYTFNYPYPVARSVDCSLGMEYPMIAFNGGRPAPDGTYSEALRNSVIGIVRHEVGHNFIPMIVNTDEREWAWMDEGFNIFLQGIGERKWDINQVWSGEPTEMTGYMDDDKTTLVPLMTSADALLQPGMNSYRKPAAGLTILRETILGRELFDQAFREYTNTWKFKHPRPADFFRIMEDASGVDLDWFWRGWFFTTDHVDQAIEEVVQIIPVYDERGAQVAREWMKNRKPEHIATIRDRILIESEIDIDPDLRDMYYDGTQSEKTGAAGSEDAKPGFLSDTGSGGAKEHDFYYRIKFRSYGGMVMPLIIKFTFRDSSELEYRIPAEIWMKNPKEISKMFVLEKEVSEITLDPYAETADIDTDNNHWPRKTKLVFRDFRSGIVHPDFKE